MKWFAIEDNKRMPVILKEPNPSPFVQAEAVPTPSSADVAPKAKAKAKAKAKPASGYAAIVKRNKEVFDKYRWAEHLLK